MTAPLRGKPLASGAAERRMRLRRGRISEALAAAVLVAKGYRILGRRVKTRAGEIDIIAGKAPRLRGGEAAADARRCRGRGLGAPGGTHPSRVGPLARAPPALSRARLCLRRDFLGAGPSAAPHPRWDVGCRPIGIDTSRLERFAYAALTLPRSPTLALARRLPDGPDRADRHPRRLHIRAAA